MKDSVIVGKKEGVVVIIKVMRAWVKSELHYPKSYEVVQNYPSGVAKIRFALESGEIVECDSDDIMEYTGYTVSDIPLYEEDVLYIKHNGWRMHGIVRACEGFTNEYEVQAQCLSKPIPLEACLKNDEPEFCGCARKMRDLALLLVNVQAPVSSPEKSANASLMMHEQLSALSFESLISPSNPAEDIVIYTDGCCLSNPGGAGGWAFVKIENEKTEEGYGHLEDCTNNIAELTAVISALKNVKGKKRNITIYSDSQYVINAFNKQWLSKWKKTGWTSSSGEPVKNIGLWTELDLLQQQHSCTWIWVKGHADNTYNNRCDALASSAAYKEKAI